MFGVCRTCLSCITNKTSARRIYRIYNLYRLKFKRIQTAIGRYTKIIITIILGIRQGVGKMLIMDIMEQNGSCMAETAEKLLTYFGYELKKKARRK